MIMNGRQNNSIQYPDYDYFPELFNEISAEEEQEPFDFNEVHLNLQGFVLEKLYYQEFAKFEKTNSSAYRLCNYNRNLKFPIFCNLSIQEGNFFKTLGRPFPLQNCRQAKFRSQFLNVTCPLNETVYQFLCENVSFVDTLYLIFPEEYDENIPYLLQKLNPKILHFSLAEPQSKFCYDTSEISQVRILDHVGSSAEFFFSIKAKNKVTFSLITNTLVRANDIVTHMQDLIYQRRNFPCKEFITFGQILPHHLEAALEVIGDRCKRALGVENCWEISATPGEEPFLQVQIDFEKLVIYKL